MHKLKSKYYYMYNIEDEIKTPIIIKETELYDISENNVAYELTENQENNFTKIIYKEMVQLSFVDKIRLLIGVL